MSKFETNCLVINIDALVKVVLQTYKLESMHLIVLLSTHAHLNLNTAFCYMPQSWIVVTHLLYNNDKFIMFMYHIFVLLHIYFRHLLF